MTVAAGQGLRAESWSTDMLAGVGSVRITQHHEVGLGREILAQITGKEGLA